MRGKLGALAIVTLVGLPAMIGFALIGGQPGALLLLPMAVIALGYAAYSRCGWC